MNRLPRLARWARLAGALLFASMWCRDAAAQLPNPFNWSDAKESCGRLQTGRSVWEDAVQCTLNVFSSAHEELHPILTSVAPGGSFAGGGTYKFDKNGNTYSSTFTGVAAVSVNQFWVVEARYDWRSTGVDFMHPDAPQRRAALYGRHRSMPAIAFYGLGASPARTDPAAFAEGETTVGGSLWQPVHPSVTLIGVSDYLQIATGEPSGTGVVPIDRVFAAPEITGFGRTDRYVRLGGAFDVHSSTLGQGPIDPGHLTVTYERYADVAVQQASFNRIAAAAIVDRQITSAQVDQRTGRLNVQKWFNGSEWYAAARVSHAWAAGGDAVPIALQETLGGTTIDGRDTLGGYADYRFRGLNNVLVQAAVTENVRGPIGLFVFGEAGQVGQRMQDIAWGRLRGDGGVGFAIQAGRVTILRAFVAVGENARFDIKLAQTF